MHHLGRESTVPIYLSVMLLTRLKFFAVWRVGNYEVEAPRRGVNEVMPAGIVDDGAAWVFYVEFPSRQQILCVLLHGGRNLNVNGGMAGQWIFHSVMNY